MISVIVPVYNVKPYLEEAIESVIGQSYKDLEIILVDDGSTDGSGEICDIYAQKDSRIKVIHQENKGLSAARNTGLDICSGEYIAFLDSDDAYCKDFLRKMLESMQKSDADISECNYAIYFGNQRMKEGSIDRKRKRFGKHLNRAGVYNTKEALNAICNGKIAVSVWGKLYRQSIWHSIRFSEGHNYEDMDIILSVFENAKRACLIEESLVMHRKRKGSITKTYSFENVTDIELAQQHFMKFIIEHTPMYFDQEIQYRYCDKMAGFLLTEYHRYAWVNIPQKDECMDFLQKKIDAMRQKIDLKHSGIKVRGAFFLYYHFPRWISVIIFAIFRLALKTFGIVNR